MQRCEHLLVLGHMVLTAVVDLLTFPDLTAFKAVLALVAALDLLCSFLSSLMISDKL